MHIIYHVSELSDAPLCMAMFGAHFVGLLEPVLRLVGAFPIAKQHASNDNKGCKNGHGDIVSAEDFSVQTYLFFVFKKWLPEAVVVGEEQIPDRLTQKEFKILLDAIDPFRVFLHEDDHVEGSAEDCLVKFPDDVSGKLIWVIDPIDGSNNYANGKDDFAVVVALMFGRTVDTSMAFLPRYNTFLIAECGNVMINGRVDIQLKPYDETINQLAFGLGKCQPEEIRAALCELVHKTDSYARRFGCMTRTVLAILTGEIDAYISLKEEAYKFLALWLMATNAGLSVNCGANPRVLNLNKAFSVSVATPEFSSQHLARLSPLAKALRGEVEMDANSVSPD